MRKNKGWRNEPVRHGLAARGIETTAPNVWKKLSEGKYGKSVEKFFEDIQVNDNFIKSLGRKELKELENFAEERNDCVVVERNGMKFFIRENQEDFSPIVLFTEDEVKASIFKSAEYEADGVDVKRSKLTMPDDAMGRGMEIIITYEIDGDEETVFIDVDEEIKGDK